MMAPFASSSAPGWRTLSDAELAAEPDARLGGVLAIIVAAAAAIAVIKSLLYLLTLMVVMGPRGSGLPALTGMFASGNSRSAWMANLNLAIPGVMFVWGIAVAAMTWLRSRATPDVAGVLVAIWQMIAIGDPAKA